jgi:hypothetical protein
MSIAMNAFGHDIKNMAFNLIKSEPISFVADKDNLNCVGFARDHIVLQMINMVDKSVKIHSPLILKLLNQFRFFLHWSCQNKLIFNVHILERKKMFNSSGYAKIIGNYKLQAITNWVFFIYKILEVCLPKVIRILALNELSSCQILEIFLSSFSLKTTIVILSFICVLY